MSCELRVATSSTALVTGSTRGIGRAIALGLARNGYTVVLNHTRDGGADTTLAELRQLSPGSCAIRADVSRSADCSRLLQEVFDRLGHLDVLVNNVGPYLERPLVDTTDDEWRRMIDGNLGSAFWCTRAALPAMRQRKKGNIINVGALNAEVSPGMAGESPAYFAAKSGLMMLTRILATTEGPHGIRVNAVSPGYVETEGYATWETSEKERMRRAVPLRRFGRPDEVAEAVSFLVSDRAAYISGAILQVHGGLWF